MPNERKKIAEARVCVEPCEGGLALSVDGTFASWYAPGMQTTRGVWDALAAPLLLLAPERRRSVLVLGLGGGSAARVVRALAPDAVITGVEYDADVVTAARKHFALDELHIEVIVADARDFLLSETRHFDFIIDDIFIGSADDVRKPEWMLEAESASSPSVHLVSTEKSHPQFASLQGADAARAKSARPWPDSGIALALRRLARGGIFSCNSIDEAPRVQRLLREKFPYLLRTTVLGYDNRIFAGSTHALNARALRQCLHRNPLLAPTLVELSIQAAR